MKMINCLTIDELAVFQESFATCAIEGNRMAQVCAGTLDRILTGKPVSDRYVMGLAIAMMADQFKPTTSP